MRRSNGPPPDCPAWAWVLIEEVRESNRQAAEDRNQAAEDRMKWDRSLADIRASTRRMEANLATLTEIQRDLREDFHLLAKVQVSMNERLGGIMTHMGELSVGQQTQTELLRQILKTLKVQGNDRSRNGRGR